MTARGIAILGVCVCGFAARAQAGWLDRFFDGASGDAPPAAAAQAPDAGPGEPIDQRYWVVLPAASSDQRSTIANAGVSIEEVSGGTVGGVADKNALDRLKALGIEPTKKVQLENSHPTGFPQPDAAFHDYSEVREALSAVAAANPKLASVFSIGSSVQGRDIIALRLNTDASASEPSLKPGIVFLGTHHAREHLSTEVPLLLAQWLAANKERADVAKLLASRDVYFIPLVNPDGAEYDHSSCRPDGLAQGPAQFSAPGRGAIGAATRGRATVPADTASEENGRRPGCSYKWQRKNMRKNPNGSLGVDLNRNYGFHWNTGGSSSDPGSDVYHGPAPFSEPETQAVKRFVEERPNLKVLLSFHTFSELILYPWGHTHDPIDDGKALAAYKAMAQKMAGWTGYTPEQSSDLYIASGDTTDWSWGEKKIFSFTFELTPRSSWEGGFYPGAKAIDPTFQKNIQPMLYLIDLADDPYRAAGGGPAARGPRRGAGAAGSK